MGETVQSPEPNKKQAIICCPVCGEDLTELPSEQIDKCPNCEFNLSLVRSPQESPILPPTQIVVPGFAYLMLVIQAILAVIMGVLFLLLASPYYFGIPSIIAIIQLFSLLIISLFLIALRFSNVIFIARIGLVIFGIVTLPLGIFSFSAAFSISAPRQRSTRQDSTGGSDGG